MAAEENLRNEKDPAHRAEGTTVCVMKRKRIQIILLSLLITVTLGFIWGNSLLPAEQSSEISGSLMEVIEEFLEKMIPGYVPAADTGDTLLRKMAHFTEFMILGIELTILLFRSLGQSIALPPFCGLLAALCDETIQLFSEGRSSQVSDVWIDFGGVLLGLVLVVLFLWLRGRGGRSSFSDSEKDRPAR